MMYKMYASARRASNPIVTILGAATKVAYSDKNPLNNFLLGRIFKASVEVPYNLIKPYEKRDYDLHNLLPAEYDHTNITETVVVDKPFAQLIEFRLDNACKKKKDKVIIAAALSGHYATLLRDIIASFLIEHDVYVTDWKNARDIPVSDGRFGFDEYATYLTEFMEHLGSNTHMVAVCQSCPQAMVATALLEEQDAPYKPKSLTLMAGPIDIRENVENSALGGILNKVPLSFFKKIAIKTVPKGYEGEGRRVYPGFMQLSGFMSINILSHLKKHVHFARNILKGHTAKADSHREFYEEYYTVLDATEEFYIETLEKVFFDQQIPKGTYQYQGRTLDFSVITETPLLTIEGEKDEFCPPGQTAAAGKILSGLADDMHEEHVIENVGHYGVFAGSGYRNTIYPLIQEFIHRPR